MAGRASSSSPLRRLSPNGLPSFPRSARLTPLARLPVSGLRAPLAVRSAQGDGRCHVQSSSLSSSPATVRSRQGTHGWVLGCACGPHHLARPPHPDAVHCDGATDRHCARRSQTCWRRLSLRPEDSGKQRCARSRHRNSPDDADAFTTAQSESVAHGLRFRFGRWIATSRGYDDQGICPLCRPRAYCREAPMRHIIHKWRGTVGIWPNLLPQKTFRPTACLHERLDSRHFFKPE